MKKIEIEETKKKTNDLAYHEMAANTKDGSKIRIIVYDELIQWLEEKENEPEPCCANCSHHENETRDDVCGVFPMDAYTHCLKYGQCRKLTDYCNHWQKEKEC